MELFSAMNLVIWLLCVCIMSLLMKECFKLDVQLNRTTSPNSSFLFIYYIWIFINKMQVCNRRKSNNKFQNSYTWLCSRNGRAQWLRLLHNCIHLLKGTLVVILKSLVRLNWWHQYSSNLERATPRKVPGPGSDALWRAVRKPDALNLGKAISNKPKIVFIHLVDKMN